MAAHALTNHDRDLSAPLRSARWRYALGTFFILAALTLGGIIGALYLAEL